MLKKGGHDAAKGILTTDKRTKEMGVSFTLGGKKVTIGAAAKGAGMVHPYMATMLCFITTDAAISKTLLTDGTSSVNTSRPLDRLAFCNASTKVASPELSI